RLGGCGSRSPHSRDLRALSSEKTALGVILGARDRALVCFSRFLRAAKPVEQVGSNRVIKRALLQFALLDEVETGLHSIHFRDGDSTIERDDRVRRDRE